MRPSGILVLMTFLLFNVVMAVPVDLQPTLVPRIFGFGSKPLFPEGECQTKPIETTAMSCEQHSAAVGYQTKSNKFVKMVTFGTKKKQGPCYQPERLLSQLDKEKKLKGRKDPVGFCFLSSGYWAKPLAAPHKNENEDVLVD
ncbi:hypothetical protein AMATHDRAFT_6977 [Amanita thiersii Skay4041]|uniref:Secreted protein n=1 Tax=Amanita thiersii Skay4041 TaxID=703135 RepID=A0A2A9NG44_9AGAR|nr:hypothetical protein AMATHDRAFT_6977 [Amanita thiersii Skay4041]